MTGLPDFLASASADVYLVSNLGLPAGKSSLAREVREMKIPASATAATARRERRFIMGRSVIDWNVCGKQKPRAMPWHSTRPGCADSISERYDLVVPED